MVSIIVAVAANGVIGDKNSLLWHISEDLRFFKRTTSGHPVIMGRKTFESLGRPLPNRTNVVISRTIDSIEGCTVVRSLEEAIAMFPAEEEVFVIGGAQIYALADWFSPADIEAPTLEWVCFSDRKTGQELKISEIPDILFSEVMRDVDLAVSVAHVGGVDPETSHSTIEMREALLSFVLPMFRIGNVRVQDHHAIIDGKLANYSVHLGSGTVHQIGGAMIPVLPVHSQHRGRIFLPFLDEDPKTAEIISKVLLFAEDGKIRDPMILSNIQQNI